MAFNRRDSGTEAEVGVWEEVEVWDVVEAEVWEEVEVGTEEVEVWGEMVEDGVMVLDCVRSDVAMACKDSCGWV